MGGWGNVKIGLLLGRAGGELRAHRGTGRPGRMWATPQLIQGEERKNSIGTDTAFTLGPWLAMARSVGDANASDCTGAPTIPPEVVGCAHFYEWNARSQLTTWNPVQKGAAKQPGGPIDYASKHWSGLVADYYRERARLLVVSAAAHARDGRRFDDNADEAVRAAHAYAFQVDTKRYPTEPVGDALDISRTMRTKHGVSLQGCA